MFEEFKQKMWYLENFKALDRGEIATNIGEYSSNLSDYLNGKKNPGPEIVARMSNNLNRVYSESLKGWANTSSQPDDPYVYGLEIRMQKLELRHRAMFNVMARKFGLSPEELQEEIEKEIRAIQQRKDSN